MKRVVLVTSILVCVVLLLSWQASTWNSPPGPVYDGRSVTEWALDLNDPSAAVRHDATMTIGKFDPDAVPALVRLLRTPDPVLARPIRAVAWRAPQKLSRVLLRFVDPYKSAVKRAAAAQSLRIMGLRAASALPALVRALDDDQTVSWYAAVTLAELGQNGATALALKLDNAQPAQAGYICYALSTMGRSASNATPALVRKLQSNDSNLVERASVALSAIGPAAVGPLTDALSSSKPGIRLDSIQALARIGPLARPAVPILIKCTASKDPIERAAAVEALGEIQPTSAAVVATLGAALSDSARSVRLKAIEGLSRSPATSWPAKDAVLRALEDENSTIRERATNLIRQMATVEPKAPRK